MKIKKILASFLALTAFSGSFAYADVFYDVAYPGLEDVYRLDIPTMYGNDVSDSGDDTNEIEYTLCMLGIMSRDETGKFRPDEKLTRAEFEAANRAVYSGEEVDFEYYNSAYEGQKIYQKEIITKLLSFVESMEIDGDSVDVENQAASCGILNGVEYSEGKEFTRREFATALWNTLNCSYVEFTNTGDGFNISVDEDKTILSEKLGVQKIDGLLNAIHGLSIYSTFAPREGYVEINRQKCRTNGIDGLEDLVGYNVEGYAKYDEDYDEFVLVYLKKAKKDETVLINLEDIEKIDDSFIYYEDSGKVKKAKIAFLEHISYNANLTDRIEQEMLDGNGTVLLGKTEKNGEYDVAIIKEYRNFYTKRYVADDMRVYFNYNATYNNEAFLDLDNDEGNVIFTVDGVRKEISDITQNLSVNVLQNSTKTYTEIIASKNSVTGTVIGEDEEYVEIDGEKLKVDSYYEEISKDASTGASAITTGAAGKFYYTVDGMIVHYEPEGTANFGLLKKVWIDDNGEKTCAKLFAQTGEWITYEMTEKVEVDGVKYEGEDISEKIKKTWGGDEGSPTPVRYILKEDKIKFIDTLYDAPEEESDLERMQECFTFSGETEWVKGWDMGGSSTYHVGNDTPMFIVPNNPEKEDEYQISTGSAIPADTKGVSFTAFNPDNYYCAKLAILNGTPKATTTETFVYIKSVTQRYDEEEDEVVEGIDCYLLTRKKEELDEMFYKLPEDWKEKFGVNNLEGAYVGIALNGDEVSGMGVTVPYINNNKMVGDYGEDFFYRISDKNRDFVFGTVIDIDISRAYMLVDTGDDGIQSVVFAEYVMAKTDVKDKKHKAEGINISEINPGDKIFYWGSLRRAYCGIILDNYEGAQ